jgi:hypothetical protein
MVELLCHDIRRLSYVNGDDLGYWRLNHGLGPSNNKHTQFTEYENFVEMIS